MKLGCHVSISKGYGVAVENAHRLGCESFQFFTKNPRAFKGKAADTVQAERGRALLAQFGLTAVAHAPYITNLSTPDPELREISIASLVQDLENAEAYGAIGTVCHMGKHVGEGEEKGMERMIDTLNELLERYTGSCPLLLENTAGQGTELGTTLEQCVEVRSRVAQPHRIGFCFDTCHGFAAGAYRPEDWEGFVSHARSIGYWEHLKAVHLNDSKFDYGSRKDRHANLGKGFIGENGMAAILGSSALNGMPVVLETPVETEDDYLPEMIYARKLAPVLS
ncbi:MAG TPA: deoxyribonuclease IV [Symbiobacteriaceae bacterium]|nr:deoxyribonuclease IV [Symbiobacteriaceae bacterium]